MNQRPHTTILQCNCCIGVWQSDKQAHKVAIAHLYSLSQLIKQINRKRNQTLAYGEMQREREKNPRGKDI